MNEQETTGIGEILGALRAVEKDRVPQGGIRRIARTAGAAMGTGLSMLGGRLRGRGEAGLSRADLRTIEKLVSNLGELKGLAMKAGQMMSYIDDTLPPDMRKVLSLLQTQSQPTRFQRIADVVTEDVRGRGAELVAAMAREPYSVASIGQVHKARLPDGTEVAVKVRHPGIREALEADFKVAAIGPVFTRLIAPSGAASVKEFMAEARARMLEECDFALEAVRQTRFRTLFQRHPHVVIPEVHAAWSGPRVLATTWEAGASLDDFLAGNPGQTTRDSVGKALFDVYFGALYRHGLFHADPHPGNYAFRDDGTAVLYDFGCMREFDRETIAIYAELGHAVMADDEARIRTSFEALGGGIPTSAKAYDHVRKMLRSFFGPMLTPGPHVIDASVHLDMNQVARDKLMLMRLHLPGKLLFLFRIRFGLYAVLARIGACLDWSQLERTESQLLP
jgi:predicted unusual protein kinase regulating ubiquinone biosynthesis (AarF/ABC1/UbiB family)